MLMDSPNDKLQMGQYLFLADKNCRLLDCQHSYRNESGKNAKIKTCAGYANSSENPIRI